MKPSKAFNGQRLKTARLFRGMTVADLAVQMELNRQTVSQYESGQIYDPGYSRIQDMSRILNFPFDFFICCFINSSYCRKRDISLYIIFFNIFYE